MPSIADVYVTVIPETASVSKGIKEVFRSLDNDAYEAGQRWGKEIQRGLGKTTVNLNADTGKATTDLDKAARDRKATVEVDADTAKANAQIDAISRDRKATVEVDADTLGSSMQRGISQGGEAGIGALQPALMGIGITMAAGIASSLSGLTALLPAGIAGAGGVIGTLALGLDGVKNAWDAAGKAADASGQDQATQAKEVASAQRQLNDAVLDEQRAQRDITTARKDALRQLKDLNLELRGGALDEKQARLDALQARQDLVTGHYKTAIDYAQAQLRVQEADQRVAEVRQRNTELQDKANDANAKGVDNADRVVAANDQLTKSQERVTAAQDSLDRANSKQSTTAQNLATAMGKLSPKGQEFVNSLRGMKPIFDQLKFSIQDTLLDGLGPVLQNLATTYLPILTQGLGSLAGTMNRAFGEFAKFMTQPQTMAAMQQIFQNIGNSFGIWAQSLQPVSQAFLTITQVGSGFLPQLAQMMVNAGNAFNQFIQQAAQSGQLQQWIQTGITALSQLGQMLTTLGPMFLALAPIGTATLGAINTLLTSLSPAIEPLAGLFASLIREITPGLGILGQLVSTVIIGLAPAFTMLFNAMAPVAQQFAAVMGPVLAQLAPILAQMSAQIGQQLATAVAQLTPQLVPMVAQFAKLLEDALPLLPQLMNFGQSVLPLITQALSLMIPWTTQMLTWVDKLVEKVPFLISPLLGLANALDSIGNKVSWLIGPLGKLLSLVPGSGGPTTPYPAGTNPLIPGVGPQPNLVAGGVQINDAIGTPGSRREHQGLPPMASALTPGNGFDWDAVAKAESSGNWQNNDTGHNGHFGGLQFSPETWKAFGGLDFAPMPNLATREQQIEIANRTAFTGYNGTKPQGLGAWETITKGMVPGVTTNTQPGAMPATGGLPSAAGAALPDVRGAHPQLAEALAAAQGLFPDLTLMAGDYDHQKDGGWHPKGQAIDIGGGTPEEQAALSNWLLQFAPDIEELIHSGPGVTQNIKSGKLGPAIDMPGSVYNSQQAGYHGDHVHLAVTDQMAQQFMAALSGGGSPMSGMTGPTGSQNDPYYTQFPSGYKPPGPDLGQLGQNMGGDLGELFLPDGFKNPAQFGAMKFFTGFLGGLLGISGGGGGKGGGAPGWMWGAMGGDGATLPAGGGGDMLGGLLSNIPQAFGPLKVGGQEQAPGQFMPTMPDGGANTILPGDVMASPFGQTGAPGTAGPGNAIDNRIVINGNIGMNPTDLTQHLDAQRNARARQPLRALPGQG